MTPRNFTGIKVLDEKVDYLAHHGNWKHCDPIVRKLPKPEWRRRNTSISPAVPVGLEIRYPIVCHAGITSCCHTVRGINLK